MEWVLLILLLVFSAVSAPILFIFIIYQLRQISDIKQRLQRLEQQITTVGAGEASQPVESPAYPEPASVSRPSPPSETVPEAFEARETAGNVAGVAPEPLKPVMESSTDEIGERPTPPYGHTVQPSTDDLSRTSLEAWLSERLFVVIGSIALTLAVIFLVRLSLIRGWITPPVRVSAGLLFGLILTITGVVRRRAWGYLADGLVATGITSLYVSVYASTALYHFLKPVFGFSLMIVITFVAILLSLQHGHLVVVIGMLGGFLTPFLIHVEQPSVVGLTLYLLILQASVLSVARVQRWRWIRAVSFIAGFVWALTLLFRVEPGSAWVGFYVFVLTLLYLSAEWPDESREDAVSLQTLMIILVGFLGFLMMLFYVPRGSFSLIGWGYFALLYASVFTLSLIKVIYRSLPWLALPLFLALYAIDLGRTGLSDTRGLLVTGVILFLIVIAPAFLSLVSKLGVTLREHILRLCCGGALALFAVDYLTSKANEIPRPWGWISFSGFVLFFIIYSMLYRESALRTSWPALTSGVFFIGTAMFTLDNFPLTVAMTAQTALFYLAERKSGERTFIIMGRILAAGVFLRLIFLESAYKALSIDTPLVNLLTVYLLVMTGIYFLSARYLVRNETDRKVLNMMASAFLWFLGFWTIRQVYHGADYLHSKLPFYELGLIITFSCIYALLNLRLSRTLNLPEFSRFARWLLVTSALLFAGVNFFLANPLWVSTPVGHTRIVNHLMEGYALPSLVFLLVALYALELDARIRLFSLLNTVLGFFIFLNLEVRQFFHGPYLSGDLMLESEKYAYSVVWIGYGLILLFFGIVFHHPVTRYGSLVVLILSILKVFLYDTAHLSDELRILSFLGLGLSLFVVAYVYRKFVFSPGRGVSRSLLETDQSPDEVSDR